MLRHLGLPRNYLQQLAFSRTWTEEQIRDFFGEITDILNIDVFQAVPQSKHLGEFSLVSPKTVVKRILKKDAELANYLNILFLEKNVCFRLVDELRRVFVPVEEQDIDAFLGGLEARFYCATLPKLYRHDAAGFVVDPLPFQYSFLQLQQREYSGKVVKYNAQVMSIYRPEHRINSGMVTLKLYT